VQIADLYHHCSCGSAIMYHSMYSLLTSAGFTAALCQFPPPAPVWNQACQIILSHCALHVPTHLQMVISCYFMPKLGLFRHQVPEGSYPYLSQHAAPSDSQFSPKVYEAYLLWFKKKKKKASPNTFIDLGQSHKYTLQLWEFSILNVTLW